MPSTASARIWNTPELKVHIANALNTQRDLLHLAQTDKATCTLLLPLLYENITVAIDHIFQIKEIFRKYPEYAYQCMRLRVESPDKIERSYLEGKRWRDKDVVVNFQPDPSKRYDASFSPDWEDDINYMASPSVVSDPIEWIVFTREDAESALRMVLREAGGASSNEEYEDSIGGSDADNVWTDEDGDDADERDSDQNNESDEDQDDSSDDSGGDDSGILGSGDESGSEAMDAAYQGGPGDDSSEEYEQTGPRPDIAIMDYWKAKVERHKDDTSPAWLKKKQIMEDHIRERQDKGPRVTEGLGRLKAACDALSLVLTQLSESGRLASFEWVWEASSPGVWPVNGASSELWAAVEKNAPSLQKLVLKLFWGDRRIMKPFTSTRYGQLRILHLNMANALYCKMRPLAAMLKELPELEALHLKLPSTHFPRKVTFVATIPKLRYFYWEGDWQYLLENGAGPTGFFRRNPSIDTLHIKCTSDNPLKFDDDSILPRLRAISYTGHLRPDLIPVGGIVSRRPVIIVRGKLPEAGLLSFVRLPAAASATVQWLDVRYYSNFRLDLATYGEALHTVPRLKELTIRTRSGRFDGRLTRLDIPDVLNAIPHDHPLTALTLNDPDGDALTASDLEDLPPISPALKYLGWETNEGRVLYALEKRGDKTVANEISHPRKQSWVWTQNSILDHDTEGGLWTDPFDGEVIPGLSQL